MDNLDSLYNQSVSERDIDWIICVELNVCTEFQSWLSNRIFNEQCISIKAWRSIYDSSLGESDIIWQVTNKCGERKIALVENKINAQATVDQCERYKLRALSLIDKGVCSECRVVLISPNRYNSLDSDQYEIRISYEEIYDFYQKSNIARGPYIAGLIHSAINKTKLNRTLPDDEISNFRYAIWEMAVKQMPEIDLKEPSPGREYWVTQNYGNYSIKYKMLRSKGIPTETYVDIELSGRADDLQQLSVQYGRSLSEIGATVAAAGKSAAFRIQTSILNPPEIDRAAILDGLEAWKRLHIWAKVNML